MTEATPVAALLTEEIHQLVSDANRYQSDTRRFIALHASNTQVVNMAGRRVVGRTALADAMTAALQTPLSRVRTEVNVDDIVLLAPHVALVCCSKQVFDERSDVGATVALPSRAQLTYVVVRDLDSWLIASAQTTPIIEG